MRHLRCAALTLAALMAFSTVCAAADDNSCTIVRAASLDMSTDAFGGPVVPLTVGGQSVNLLIDTGGIDSMLTESTVANLKLMKQSIYGARVVMFGGDRIVSWTSARDIDLGGLKARKMPFMVMPDGHLPEGVGGTLAPDVMRAYDDEFDFANAKFNLFVPNQCRANLAYWTKDEHAEISVDVDQFGQISFIVELDGKKFRAGLDTGSSRSILGLEDAENSFGFKESDPQLQILKKTANGHVYKFPFKTLSFGGVTVSNPDLELYSRADVRMSGGPPLILGMGILRQLHMYIAYRERVLYVTPASAR
jgi:predicted aspartyl protease